MDLEMNENEKANYEKIKERKKVLKWMMEKLVKISCKKWKPS
jgi:hypothetical protein